MLRLAVITSLLPEQTRAAQYARAVLPVLEERAEVTLVVPDPHQLSLDDERRYRLAPIADVGHLVASGAVDVPIYIFGEEEQHAGQMRWIEECPGVLVLLGGTAHRCIGALTAGAGFDAAYLAELGIREPAVDARRSLAQFRGSAEEREQAVREAPCLRGFVAASLATVIPSASAGASLGAHLSDVLEVVPAAAPPRRFDRSVARAALGLDEGVRVIALDVGDERTRERALGAALAETQGSDDVVLACGETVGARNLAPEEFAAVAVAAADGLVVDSADGDPLPPVSLLSAVAHGVPVLCGTATPHPEGAGVCAQLGEDPADWISRPTDPATVDAVASAEALLAVVERVGGSAAVRVPDRQWPTVEAMVLAYKSKDYIGPCIESLLEQDYPNLKITVIDNNSGDGTGKFIEERYPGVHVIHCTDNLGFAGGNNALFDQSDADYFALLNHDAIARRDWVRQLVDVAERDPSVASVGAKMMMRRCPTIINSTAIRMNEGAFAADRDIGRRDTGTDPTPERVFGVCGGAKLIRGDAVRRYGGFDATFFMYFEDVDFCWRLGIAGQRVFYAPLAVVVHDWHGDMAGDNNSEGDSGVTARVERRRFLCERNRLQCVYKNYESANRRRVERELKRFDKVRLGWCKDAIATGNNVDYFAMVMRAIRGARSWCRKNALGLWRRRRAAQRLRTVPDTALEPLIDRGVGEPSYIGDLDNIRDRHCVTPEARLSIGVNDREALGAGWYGVEPVADQEWDVRWTMGEAVFYLRPDSEWQVLKIRLVPQPRPTTMTVWINGVRVGSHRVDGRDQEVVEFRAFESQPKGELAEFELRCGTFCPAELSGGEDRRQLGVHLAEAWVEPDA